MLRKMEAKDAKAISKIHINALGGGFLSSLGEDFLKMVYEGIISSKWGVGYVHIRDSKIVGFITGSMDTSKIFKDIYFKKPLSFGKIIFTQALRNPRTIKKIYQSWRYPDLVENKVNAELLSIAVIEEFRGKGIGKQLVSELINCFGKNDIQRFTVSVDSSLAGAKEFYKAMGFKITESIDIYDKTMDIFIYEL